MHYFTHHRVSLKKKRKGWNLDTYDVIAMDIKTVSLVQDKQEEYKVINPDEPMVINHLDDDDEEYLDELSEKKTATPSVEKVIVWLLIANPNNGKYLWLTTEDVKFNCVTC